MNSNWFDFDEDLSPEIFGNADKFELLKKTFGLSSRQRATERQKKLKSWSSVNKVNDIFDVDCNTSSILSDKLWESVMKDRLTGGRSRFSSGDRHHPVSDTECDDLLSEISESARRVRSRFSRERFDWESESSDDRRKTRSSSKRDDTSPNSTFSTYVSKKGVDDGIWSRKSSCQGNVTFPPSSSASDAASEKSFGRSVSVNSEESVCTEKSADCSTVCETLPDGTNKMQFENNETWLSKSTSGSTICEKQVRDTSVTERNEDAVRDKSIKRTSYAERSSTGSSLQEESTERTVSRDSTGGKTVQQKMTTTSETYRKSYRSPRNTFCLDDIDSRVFRSRLSSRSTEDVLDERQRRRGANVSERISKLIDEAVHQDNLLKMQRNLESDMDRVVSDFAELKSHTVKEGRNQREEKRTSSGISTSETGKPDHDLTRSKFNELKKENEALAQENSKLQSIIQDVTAVNKRWQKYNNERRLYVQNLLSTIQDLQEQINLISEKSAFQTSQKDNPNHLYENVEKLKRDFQDHVAILDLQIKSHKDDWEAERKEKQKILHEKELLERKVEELSREVKFLRSVFNEKKATSTPCTTCKGTLDEGAIFPRSEYFPSHDGANSFVPKSFRTAVHLPYGVNELPSNECFYSNSSYMSTEESNSHKQSYFSNAGDDAETYLRERFRESTNFSDNRKTSGDTIVVEDENGIRLSITEQFPSKATVHLKSILKKTDKRLKMLSPKSCSEAAGKTGGGSRIWSSNSKDFESRPILSIGFKSNGLGNITSFIPYPIPDVKDSDEYQSSEDFLRVGNYSRSRSEPNTRSNSSENLKPLRESSSWNNQCPSEEPIGDAGCTECDRSFPPSISPQALQSTYEASHHGRNHF